jgi:hypothetical protein
MSYKHRLCETVACILLLTIDSYQLINKHQLLAKMARISIGAQANDQGLSN